MRVKIGKIRRIGENKEKEREMILAKLGNKKQKREG